MKKISLIILNWNGWKMTLDCLRSLQHVKITNFQLEIIVVDNGSTDESIQEIEEYIKQQKKLIIKMLKNSVNLGFAEGNNAGIRYALADKADYICLLNNDVRVDPTFLEALFITLESEKKVGIAGGKIYFEKGFEFHKERYKKEDLGKVVWYAGGLIDWQNIYATHRGLDEIDEGQFEAIIDTDYVNGCLFLARREVFEKVGFFDANYYMYYEDVDLSIRAERAGFEVKYCPKSKIWHMVAGSSGIGSGLNDYFITRNRLFFGMKYASFRSKIALIKESLRLITTGRLWQKTGAKDFYLRKFGRGSWR